MAQAALQSTNLKVWNIEGVKVYQEMLDDVDERIREMERLN